MTESPVESDAVRRHEKGAARRAEHVDDRDDLVSVRVGDRGDARRAASGGESPGCRVPAR